MNQYFGQGIELANANRRRPAPQPRGAGGTGRDLKSRPVIFNRADAFLGMLWNITRANKS
jgi:hypothetical protein